MKQAAINKIRETCRIPESVSDERIESDLAGTLTEAFINISIALSGLRDEIKKRRTFQKLEAVVKWLDYFLSRCKVKS